MDVISSSSAAAGGQTSSVPALLGRRNSRSEPLVDAAHLSVPRQEIVGLHLPHAHRQHSSSHHSAVKEEEDRAQGRPLSTTATSITVPCETTPDPQPHHVHFADTAKVALKRAVESIHDLEEKAAGSLHHVQVVAAHRRSTRWLILFVYCMLSASNGFQWINYAPIIDEVKEYFQLDSLQVNFLATIYTIVYPALVILGCVTFQRLGCKGGMVVGAVLNAAGAVMKVIGAQWLPVFPFLAFSQCVNAFSEVFFLSLPPLIASVWFSSHQRTIATSLGVMSNSLGTALGFLIPPLLVNKSHRDRWAFVQLFLYQAIVAVMILAATLFVPRRPAHLPSVTAAKSTSLRELLPTLKYLITHGPFVILAFASGLTNDSLGTFASFLAQLLQPFGIDELKAGWIGFAMTISGCVASTLVGLLVDRYRNYKPMLMTFSFGSLLCFSIITLLLLFVGRGDTLFGLSFFFITAMGGLLSAQIPLQLEYAVELTYPKPEGISTAFLLCLSGILTPLLTLGGTEIVGDTPAKSDVVRFMVGCMALCATSATMQLFIRDHKHRVEIEQKVPINKHASTLDENRARYEVNNYGNLSDDDDDDGLHEDDRAESANNDSTRRKPQQRRRCPTRKPLSNVVSGAARGQGGLLSEDRQSESESMKSEGRLHPPRSLLM